MILGIHHITALASDPQRNVEFYTEVLGLRLVKRTVNFDAPDTYHLYYGDEAGRPGTILTFFPFPDAVRGKRGVGEISSVAFCVPAGAMDYWIGRLSRFGLHIDGPEIRFRQEVITFQDPDGMMIDLVLSNPPPGCYPGEGSSVPEQFAIRRLHGVTLTLADREPTDQFLRKTLGFTFAGQEGNRFRFEIGVEADYVAVDISANTGQPPARQSAGSVHHIAWRVASDANQAEWRTKLTDAGISVTGIRDRQYFRSIYFREPGDVLFEIATDGPGFTVDEPLERLGARLMLPPWLEHDRPRIERILPPLELKATVGT